MSKSVSVTQQAAFRRLHGMPVVFGEADWFEGLERYVTAGADVQWNGYTWKGIGDIVNIESVKETGSVESTAVRFTLAAVHSSQIARALATRSLGRRVTLWFGTMNPETHALDDAPIVEFQGRMDAPSLVDSSSAASVSILAESRMASLLGANVRRYTDADQQAFHPGDTWCKFAAVMAEKLIVFPSKEVLQR